MVTMFVFGVLANAARHEPEAIAALTRGGRGARPANAVGRPLRIPPPQPYRGRSRPARCPTTAVRGRVFPLQVRARARVMIGRRRGRGHRRAHRAGAGVRRRGPPPAPGRRRHRAGHREGPRHPPHPGARLPAGADPAGAAAAQAERRPAAAAGEGVRRRCPRSARCCAGPTRTSSSGSAATSRCPPTSPRAAAPRSSCTRPTPGPGWRTRSAPGSRPGSPPRCPAAGCRTPRCSGSRCGGR